MENLMNVSQFDLFFFSKDVLGNVQNAKSLLDPMVRASLGEGWAERLQDDTEGFRAAVELVIRETTETTDALRRIEQLSQNVSQWRALGAGIARNAAPARREVLLQAVGYGLGTARSTKEMKDMLLTIKSRVAVHGAELVKNGLAPELLDLPARVLAALERGAGEVAREKAEDSLARADARELFARVAQALTTVWRSAELLSLQSLLLAERDDRPATQSGEDQAQAAKLGALTVVFEKSLGEARVQARKRAASEALPAELTTAVQVEEEDGAVEGEAAFA